MFRVAFIQGAGQAGSKLGSQIATDTSLWVKHNFLLPSVFRGCLCVHEDTRRMHRAPRTAFAPSLCGPSYVLKHCKFFPGQFCPIRLRYFYSTRPVFNDRSVASGDKPLSNNSAHIARSKQEDSAAKSVDSSLNPDRSTRSSSSASESTSSKATSQNDAALPPNSTDASQQSGQHGANTDKVLDAEGRMGESVVAASDEPEPEVKQGLFKRFRETYKQYGKILVGVHMFTSTIWTACFYYAAVSGVDVIPLLVKLGFGDAVIAPFRLPGVGHAAVAYLMYKLMTPVRYTVTIGGTQLAVKYMRQWGYLPPIPDQNKLRSLAKEGKTQVKERYGQMQDKFDDIRHEIKDFRDEIKQHRAAGRGESVTEVKKDDTKPKE